MDPLAVRLKNVPPNESGSDPHMLSALRHTLYTQQLNKVAELSDWNRFGLVDEIVVREYYCPRCALLASTEVRRRGEPPLADTRLALAAREPALA